MYINEYYWQKCLDYSPINEYYKFSYIDHCIKGCCEKYLQNTSDRMAINLIRMFKLGPLVSFKGSPTVSPMTAAL
jgi:hypothetical protein